MIQVSEGPVMYNKSIGYIQQLTIRKKRVVRPAIIASMANTSIGRTLENDPGIRRP